MNCSGETMDVGMAIGYLRQGHGVGVERGGAAWPGTVPAMATCGAGVAADIGLKVPSGRYGPVDNVAANANHRPEKQACNHADRVIRLGLQPEGPHKEVASTPDHAFNEELKKKAPGHAGHSSQC